MKKYLLFATILLQTTFLFGQSAGTVVKSKTIYSGSGLTISYSITYYGNGDCNDKPNSYYKKYRIDFTASNTSSSKIKLYGSRIDLDDNLNHFQDNCRTAAAILLGSYPGFEYFGILEPNEKQNAKMYCYMLASSTDLPYISYSIIPIIEKEKQNTTNTNVNTNTTKNSSSGNNLTHNSNTSNSSSTQYKNTSELINRINELCTEFQSLLNERGITNSTYNLYCKNNSTYTENDYNKAKSIVSQLESAINNEKSKNVSTNKTNAQENDLTEYNRSKAEMEQKLATENARIQRENQENANKKQQFINVYNQGVQLGNTGKYSEAAVKYQEAIGLATNDADRQTAQNAYNKISKAGNQMQAINQLGTTLIDAAKILDEANAKRKAEKKAKIEAELAEKKSYYDLLDDELFGGFVLDVLFEFKKYGYEPTKIGDKSGNQVLNSKDDKLPELRSMHLQYQDFTVSIMWFYSENYGEDKKIMIIGKDAKLFDEFKKKKILNKWANKKNKPEYYERGNSATWSSIINNIEFTRNSVSNLPELNTKRQQLAEETYNVAYSSFKSKDYEKAEKLFLQSANLGHEDAMLKLSVLYAFTEDFTPKEYYMAKSWAENAAELGNNNARFFLGLFYYNGWGVKKDYVQSVVWYSKVSGDYAKDATYRIGSIYLEGGNGLEQDLAAAKQWFLKSCDNGMKEGCDKASKIQITQPKKQQKDNNIGEIFIQNFEEIKQQKTILDWNYIQLNSVLETRDLLKQNGYTVDELESSFSKEGGTSMVVTNSKITDKFIYLRFLKNNKAEASIQQFSQNRFPYFPVNAIFDNIKFIEDGTKKQLSSFELSEAIAKTIAQKGEVKVAIVYDNGNMISYRFFIDKNNFSGALFIEGMGFKKKGQFNITDYDIQFVTKHSFSLTQIETSMPNIGKILPIR